MRNGVPSKHTATERTQNSLSAQAISQCEQVWELIDAGDYEAARAHMAPFWEYIEKAPVLDGLDEEAQATVLLRAGALTGWIGSTQQIPNSQQTAKDLLSQSRSLYEEINNLAGVAEAQVDLALCYWREGAFDESRILLETTLKLVNGSGLVAEARAILNLSILYSDRNQYQQSLDLLLRSESLFESLLNNGLKGRFHHELAYTFRHLGLETERSDYRDRAYIEFEAASHYFEMIGNERTVSSVQNNLGELALTQGDFAAAHSHIGRAKQIGLRLNDQFYVANFNETLARLYLAQHTPDEAIKFARQAVAVLEQGGEQTALVQAQITYGIALARMQNFEQSQDILEEARQSTLQFNNPATVGEIALTMIEEIGDHLASPQRISLYQEAYDKLHQTQDCKTLERLSQCAASTISGLSRELGFDLQSPSHSLEERVRRYEGYIIKQELEIASGHISIASKALGITHQTLAYILRTRQKELFLDRIPPRKRRRSIINKAIQSKRTRKSKK